MTDARIEFVFGEMNDQLNGELKAFWNQYGKGCQNELESFRARSNNNQKRLRSAQKPISRQPAAISRDQSGAINGIIFIVLREIETSLDLGGHAYFQRMYIAPTCRQPRLANQLFRAFLHGLDHDTEKRDHRAKVLLAENINSGLNAIIYAALFFSTRLSGDRETST